jgi:cytochrome c-type biogenesis protein CcmE
MKNIYPNKETNIRTNIPKCFNSQTTVIVLALICSLITPTDSSRFVNQKTQKFKIGGTIHETSTAKISGDQNIYIRLVDAPCKRPVDHCILCDDDNSCTEC